MCEARYDFEESSEEDNVIVRRPRIFRRRTLALLAWYLTRKIIIPCSVVFTYEFNERFRLGFEEFNIVLTGIERMLVHPTKRNYALTSQEH